MVTVSACSIGGTTAPPSEAAPRYTVDNFSPCESTDTTPLGSLARKTTKTEPTESGDLTGCLILLRGNAGEKVVLAVWARVHGSAAEAKRAYTQSRDEPNAVEAEMTDEGDIDKIGDEAYRRFRLIRDGRVESATILWARSGNLTIKVDLKVDWGSQEPRSNLAPELEGIAKRFLATVPRA